MTTATTDTKTITAAPTPTQPTDCARVCTAIAEMTEMLRDSLKSSRMLPADVWNCARAMDLLATAMARIPR